MLPDVAVAEPHAVAFASAGLRPSTTIPTVATPGVLEDIDEDEAGPQSLVDADSPSGLDASVDNRDQVQPMLDTLYKDAVESQEAAADPEAQAKQIEESREASRKASETAAKEVAKR